MRPVSPPWPNLLRGALVVYESHTAGPPPEVILFQYNPEQVTRSLTRRAPKQPEAGNVGAAQEDVLRVFGPPEETITLNIVLAAADYLETPDQYPVVAEKGLHPVLAILEMLLYPPTSRTSRNQALASQGAIEVTPEDLPLTLLVFGRSRVVPVMITSFAVTEEAFDPRLNPIRARVDLGLRVLTDFELPQESQGRHAFVTYLSRKEALAGEYRAGQATERIQELLRPG